MGNKESAYIANAYSCDIEAIVTVNETLKLVQNKGINFQGGDQGGIG